MAQIVNVVFNLVHDKVGVVGNNFLALFDKGLMDLSGGIWASSFAIFCEQILWCDWQNCATTSEVMEKWRANPNFLRVLKSLQEEILCSQN